MRTVAILLLVSTLMVTGACGNQTSKPSPQFRTLHYLNLMNHDVSRSWAEKNLQVVKDILQTLLTVYQQITANPQLLYDESVKRLPLDPGTAKALCDAYLQMGIWRIDGGWTAENVQYTLDFLTNTGALQSGLKAGDVADLSYLKAALDEIAHQKGLLIQAQ